MNALFLKHSFIYLICGLLILTACQNKTETQKTINVYSARHYDSDRALYKNFEKKTEIKINLIEAKGDLLIEKIKADGKQSPADIIITVDAGRLWRAEQAGLIQPFYSDIIEKNIPENLRHPNHLWFALTKRARVIVYRKTLENPARSYAELADPIWKKKICIRSSDNIYNQSLLASIVEKQGIKKAEDWAKSVYENLARQPRGGDTDQIRAVALGECDLALVNHYYYARLMNSDKAEDQKTIKETALIWPDQSGDGAHINISGAAMAKNAPHRESAKLFLEYLSSPEAQRIMANGNFEFPAYEKTNTIPALLNSFGKFKEDTVNVSVYGSHQKEAQKIFDRVGWP